MESSYQFAVLFFVSGLRSSGMEAKLGKHKHNFLFKARGEKFAEEINQIYN